MTPRASMPYRPDIDGLRALAVVLVVLGHAGVPGFGGGFFGVDVFFVISGFLITGLLVEEFRATGRFDAARFYERRVRRLLPAFAIVMATTLALAAVLLSPAELARHAKEASWAAAWMANIHQVWSDTSYFGETRESGLFLHAWSLSVEEQFYLLWPILLLAAWRLARGASGLRRVVPLATVMAFAWGVWRAHVDPVSAYFLPDARAWQLMIGACAFLWVDRHGSSARAPWLGALGFVLVVFAVVGVDKSSGNLVLLSALPTFGATLILVAGAGGFGGVTGALGSPWPVAVGRVSYGWYLWHWPALVLAAVVLPGSVLGVLLAVAVSFALAHATHRWVEQPIRRARSDDPRPVVVLGVVGSIAMALVALQVARIAAPPPTQQAEEGRHPLQAAVTVPEIYAAGCDDWYRTAELKPCYVPPWSEGAPTVVVAGDSIGLQWFPAIRSMFQRRGWNVVVLTKSACAMVDRPLFYERIGREYTECAEWRDSVSQFIRDTRPERVILGSAGSYAFDEAEWTEGTIEVLSEMSAPGRRIDILGPSPTLPFDGVACLMRHHSGLPSAVSEVRCAVPLEDARWVDVERWLAAAATRVPGVRFIETSTVVCPGTNCAAWNAGRLVFRDAQHLNADFTLSVEGELESRLGVAGSGR